MCYCAVLSDWFKSNSSTVSDLVNILQGIVIMAVAIFTARWTYRTFAHKEKINELKALKQAMELYHLKLTMFGVQVRQDPHVDQKEMEERMELGLLHNKMLSLSSLNLYTKPEFRKTIMDIVGRWLANERIQLMQRRPGWEEKEEERKKLWQKFSSEYEEVRKLIDNEAQRLI